MYYAIINLMRADFFVHPEYARTRLGIVTPQVEAYEKMIRAKIEDSALPVLVTDIGLELMSERICESAMTDLFPEDNTFTSGRMFVGTERATSSGVVSIQEEEEELRKFVTERGITDAVVHGSCIGMCVKSFSAQLFAMLTGLDDGRPAFANRRWSFSAIDLEVATREGLVATGPVKMGTVLRSDDFDMSDIYAQLASGDVSKMCTDAQLFGPETLVCEMR